ncbi:hypothetical protein AMTRI_Chr09g36690 [Amborella trichopoda]|uniref:F-box domain-containing protein n=1 Tax=Amborella trichopoda TaxID=13333 RepID=W1NM14_AMBTC|nr:EID1-like F-box protein 3 [Amborella trichopoda]ERM96561.1 hypothetical protein AMTR_s00001p00269360 [Amborella trichopoda]|eukprot:XP_006829145.1 EID1-like F-box protein 3 [Amborella trichopoda]
MDLKKQKRWRRDEEERGFLNERVLMLVFRRMNWEPHALSHAACVSKKLEAVAKRLLWRELCVARAPRIVAALTAEAPSGRIDGGWPALAKLFLFCCGFRPSRHFKTEACLPGHSVHQSRFSKTSGKSFLLRQCRGDLLYVSDPCEHSIGHCEDEIGVYRGVFRRFGKSRTLACLIRRRVRLEAGTVCPYCRAGVWSMTAAGMVPRSAARRLGACDGCLEYFVCVNGHLHGSCWLVPLSADEGDDDDAEDIGDEKPNKISGFCN